MPCEDEGKDLGDVAEAKGWQRLPANHQNVEEKHETDLPSQPLEGTNPTNTLISDCYFQKL